MHSFNSWVIFHCVYVPQCLIHSSADGHLCCIHIRAIVNSAVVNTGVRVSLSILVSLVCMPSSGIAGLYDSSFPMSQPFAWGGQSIGISASASVLPMNTQEWSPLGWNGWITLQSKGLSRVFSNTTFQKHKFSALSFLYGPTLTSIYDYWKNHSLD